MWFVLTVDSIYELSDCVGIQYGRKESGECLHVAYPNHRYDLEVDTSLCQEKSTHISLCTNHLVGWLSGNFFIFTR